MTPKSLLACFITALLTAGPFLLFRPLAGYQNRSLHFSLTNAIPETDKEEKEEEENEAYTEQRTLHEFKMLRNPITGTIPANIEEIETRVLKSIPAKHGGDLFRTNNQNAYTNVGPTNVAGRDRSVAFDRRNVNIMLTGGVTGGIFRSTDGGATWTFVSGENNIRSATSIVQDPVTPDTWYCGTGEVWHALSTSIAFTVGYGIYKSTNNGVSWTKLSATEDGQEFSWNGGFDLVHRMAVHPTTGHVYAAVHNRIVRSTDGGTTWTTVLGGSIGQSASNGLTEILIAPNGSKLFAAFTGTNTDRSLGGVWESNTGNGNDWRRIAGGVAGQADSVAGWQPYGQWSRVVLNLNSANNRLFVLYKNGKSAEGANPQPEADLFRANIPAGTSMAYTWTNLSAWVPDEPNYNRTGIDPYTTQFLGFNMAVTPKPDNDNILFIGGTAMHRVDLTKTDPAQKFRRIGGYGDGFFPSGNFIYPDHHPDIHKIVFLPGANDVLYTASDGGVHRTATSTLADTVRWQPRITGLQTVQFQKITIHPDTEADFVAGGTQDNGTLINLNPTNTNHSSLSGGDGAATAISKFSKNGNIWTQYMYSSAPLGTIYRISLKWTVSGNSLSGEYTGFNTITPTGQTGNAQFVTLFAIDPDSTEHIYYSSKNKLFRTRSASTVDASGWTEITGVGSAIPATDAMTTITVSKARNGVKYLYIGTDGGKVFRVDNANVAPASVTPVNITPTNMTANSFVADVCVNPRNPDTVMAVVANYDAGGTIVNNIFWTGNATAATPTWQVLDGALGPVSSQSCAIVVKTTGVEYYVGTSIGLYSTTAIAGNNTQWFNEGSGMMKRAIIRSLYNRQQDNTLVVGTHGNGAFLAKIGNAVQLANNIVTGISAPITNDRNFIRSVFPTISRNTISFTTGNLLMIRSITVQLFGMNGQTVYQAQQGYQNGSVTINALPAGTYILQISSADGRYRHVQKILKE